MVPSALLEPADNPYRSKMNWDSPTTRGGYTDADLIELRAFVGSNVEHFLRKWLPRLEDPQHGDVGFSWICLFFPYLWFGYRRMYKVGLLLTGTSCLVLVLQQIVFLNNSRT